MKLDSTTTMWLVRACVVDWRDLICSFIPFIRIIRVFRVGTSFPLFFYPKGSAFSCVYCVFHKKFTLKLYYAFQMQHLTISRPEIASRENATQRTS